MPWRRVLRARLLDPLGSGKGRYFEDSKIGPVWRSHVTGIRVLYRQDDTLCLWGLPYELREGQAPRHIDPRCRDDWIFLGYPGWWGSLPARSQSETTAFLALCPDMVPQGPHDWIRVAEWHPSAAGDLCHDENGDGICDGCGAELTICRTCGGRGYHRAACPLKEE